MEKKIKELNQCNSTHRHTHTQSHNQCIYLQILGQEIIMKANKNKKKQKMIEIMFVSFPSGIKRETQQNGHRRKSEMP